MGSKQIFSNDQVMKYFKIKPGKKEQLLNKTPPILILFSFQGSVLPLTSPFQASLQDR